MNNTITPLNRVCNGIGIKYIEGQVSNPECILTDSPEYTELIWNEGEERPYLCLDLGPASPGGYPFFTIEGFDGEPIVRISYSDWYDYICDPVYRNDGDFKRGTCKYLGPELPVLPGNPNRFELYPISRTGIYTYPLIQGQQRFALITLENPGCSVKISSFYIHYTSSLQPYEGRFSCSNLRLNRLWDASIYTVQLATIANSSALDIVGDRMMVRALTKGNKASILKNGINWTNYTLQLNCELPLGTDCENAILWSVYATDVNNGYVFRLSQPGKLRFYIRKNGVNFEKTFTQEATATLQYNQPFCIKTRISGNDISVSVDGIHLATITADEYSCGSVGFCPASETWFLVKGYTVTSSEGNILYTEDFTNGLRDYLYTAAKEFVADGAKRDRLPWVGDLYWAFQNVYYSFGNFTPAENTIDMFRRHQCPDGYVWGTCYPENRVQPSHFDYGYYQSDIFSAWYVITIAYHYLHTAEKNNLEKWYDSVKRDLNYLSMQVEDSGLFYQKYETSKGLWDHVLNDYGYYSYNNIIVQQAFREGATLAKAMGDNESADHYLRVADHMLKAIFDTFFDESTGIFVSGTNNQNSCYLSTSFAFAFGLIPKEFAKKTVQNMFELQSGKAPSAKSVILFMQGCFRYGFGTEAYQILTSSTGHIDFLGNCTLNWIDAVHDEKGPACTIESMPYGPIRIANGECWSDSSHPDTAVAFLMSGGILGIRPTAPGYKEFCFQPQTCSLSHASGIFPTPYGTIEASFEINEKDELVLNLSHPEELHCNICLEKKYQQNAIIHIRHK